MAGLYEGEGCVVYPKTFDKPQRGRMLRVKLKMTDRDVLQKFKDKARAGCMSGPYAPSGLGKKETWDLTINGRAAYALLIAMFFFLCSRRRRQITEALTCWRSVKLPRKLDGFQVREIRARYGEPGKHKHGRVSATKLAEEYNVSRSLIYAVLNRRMWDHV
jgi:hypothetical protein